MEVISIFLDYIGEQSEDELDVDLLYCSSILSRCQT